MPDDYEYGISTAAIGMYRLGVPVFSMRQLEQQLWRKMVDTFYVRRAQFRRAAEDLPWNSAVIASSDAAPQEPRARAGESSNTKLKSILLYPSQLLEDFLAQPVAKPDLESAYIKASVSLGKLANEVAQHPKAIRAYHDALERAEQLGREHPHDAGYQVLQRDSQTGLAVAYRDHHRFEEARLAFDQALDVARQLTQKYPKDRTMLVEVQQILMKQAVMYEMADCPQEGSAILCQVRDATDQLMYLRPSIESVLSDRLAKRYDACFMEPERRWLHLALETLQETCDAWRVMYERDLEIPDFDDKLIGGLLALEVLYHQVDPEHRGADHPQEPGDHDHYAYLQYGLAQSFEALELPNTAKKAYAKALSAFGKLVQACPKTQEYRIGLTLAQCSFGRIAWDSEPQAYRWTNYPESVRPART